MRTTIPAVPGETRARWNLTEMRPCLLDPGHRRLRKLPPAVGDGWTQVPVKRLLGVADPADILALFRL